MPHGYEYVTCPRCGWKGYTDTGVCEGDGCYYGSGRTGREEHCDKCGRELTDDRWGAHKAHSVVDQTLCEDCACEDGVCHETKSVTTYHTARRDHADGRVKKGDRYRRTVDMGYVVGGGRWLTTYKRVVRPAAATA